MLKIWELPKDEEQAIGLLQEKGIIHEVRLCAKGHFMKLYVKKETQWACRKKECRTHVGMRAGTWLANARIPCLTIVRFIYAWSEEMSSIKWCAKQLGMGKNTVVDWNNYMREVCVSEMATKNNGKIGGVGKHVEIDESMFSRRKSNAGRVLPQQWIFGGVCRETDQCFVVKVPDRTFATLMASIIEHIEPGTTIYSDSWSAYKTPEIERAGFRHLKVNHSRNFVDPTTGAHTQKIERLWGSAKWRNKRHHGTARHHLDSYLVEFLWRRLHVDEDLFLCALKAISEFWPPGV